MGEVVVVNHALVQHKLTLMRSVDTAPPLFRQLLREIAVLLAYEAFASLPTQPLEVQTPLGPAQGLQLSTDPAIISILRAGNGLLDGFLDIVPSASVGFIGMYRDHETLEPVEYYFKAPDDLSDRLTIVVDPMLATANSAILAVDKLKERGAKDLRFLCLLAAPEGVANFEKHHPDVPIFTASIDSHLNELGYIVPGLGDAGDRMYGTK